MSKVEKLRQEMAEKMAQAEREDAIAAALDKIGAPKPHMIHLHNLYGSCASLSYGDRYGRDPGLTMADVLKLAELFPGVPRVQVRDGCLSFQPKPYVDSLPEEKKNGWASEMDVCPVLVKMDGAAGCGTSLEIEWYTDLPGVGIVEVSCNFRYPPASVGTYSAKRTKFMGGFKYETPATTINAYHVKDDAGEILAEVQPRITWGSGGPEYPKPVTYFWVDVLETGRTTAAEQIKAMA